MKRQKWASILLLALLIVWAGIFLYTRPKALPQPVQSGTHTIVVPQPPYGSTVPTSKEELLNLVNQERAKNGVPPIAEDARLDQSAQRKADDETTYNYFGHVSPHDGMHGYQYINYVGISCVTDGENLTDNTIVNSAKRAVDAWIGSPPHHEAMVSPNYSLTGFGISGDHIVEHFCQP